MMPAIRLPECKDWYEAEAALHQYFVLRRRTEADWGEACIS